MTIVILCKDESQKAMEILEDLIREGVSVRAVVAETRKEIPLTAKRLIQKLVRSSWKELFQKVLLRIRLSRNGVKPKEPGEISSAVLSKHCRVRGVDYIRVEDTNGSDGVSILEGLKPDLLILGGTGIIRKQVLRIPRIGTLNAHMGLLPKYRGMNVAEWSVFHSDPVGVTVHFVDEGVDTGPILYRETIETEDCDTIERLRLKVSRRQHQILARSVRSLTQLNEVQPMKQDASEGKQYFTMHPRLKRLLEQKLRSMASRPQSI